MTNLRLSLSQHRRLRALLLRCDDLFDTNPTLRALFNDPRLRIWRLGLPDADSLRSRIDLLISYLSEKRNREGEESLILLLWTLAERYDPSDERHDQLLALASEFAYGVRVALPPNNSNDAQLERRIRDSNAMLDLTAWIARLDVIKAQVCRISVTLGDQASFGTGFLFGPACVITNYHVVERVIRGQIPPTNVRLLFDYYLLEDGVTPHSGQSYALHPEEWLLDASPYSSIDRQINPATDPQLDELDYALLRVDGEPGHAAVARLRAGRLVEEPRGWIRIPDTEPTWIAGGPLLIVQHPDGKELKLAFDTDAVIGLNGNGTRVRYRTNTEPGSSGSPCFDANWNLVALHHSGDPNFAPLYHPTYNQGIPFAAIRNLLDQRCKLIL